MAEDSFLVEQNPELGRYGVASRDLRAGEVVGQEEPFAVGPKTDSTVVCLVCNGSVDGSEGGPKCSECGWPLCENCAGRPGSLHDENECKVFKENQVKFQAINDPEGTCHQLDCVTPMR